jgi:hypothetical protein
MEKSLSMRIKEFFGLSAQEAVKEIRSLDEKDKADYVRLFNEAGMPTTYTPAQK